MAPPATPPAGLFCTDGPHITLNLYASSISRLRPNEIAVNNIFRVLPVAALARKETTQSTGLARFRAGDGRVAGARRAAAPDVRVARESGTVGKRASGLRGKRGPSVATPGLLRAGTTDGPGFWWKEALLATFRAGIEECQYRRSAILAQPGARLTDTPRFPRSRARGSRCHAWRAPQPIPIPTTSHLKLHRAGRSSSSLALDSRIG